MSKITGKVNYKSVLKGDTGYTYKPHVTTDGVLYWSNNGNLPNPLPVNIKGKNGDMAQSEEINKINNKLVEYGEQKSYISASYFGVVSDSISFSENKFLYNHDNTLSFQKAFDSGYNITIPPGHYFVSETILINKSIKISGNDVYIYMNPVENKNKSIFKTNCDGIEINGINFVSENVYTPIIGNNIVTGKSSNIYGIENRNSDIKISKCNSYDCFSINYNYGYENNIKRNLEVTNCNSYGSVFGFFCRFYENIKLNNCYLNLNDSGLNDFSHHIYIGTESKYITINSIILTGGSYSLYDCISLHDSIKNTKNIYNIEINNVTSYSESKGFITLAHCDRVNINNCYHYPNDSKNQKNVVWIDEEVTNVTFNNCEFNLSYAYSIIHFLGLNDSYENISFNKTKFILKDTNATIFKHLANISLFDCDFILKSTTPNKYLTIIDNTSTNYSNSKYVNMINCKFIGDENTKIDKIISSNSELNDVFKFLNCIVDNKNLTNKLVNISGNVVLEFLGCSFYNFNIINDDMSKIIEKNNFISSLT